MEENIRVRYSDKELEEFKALIEEKIKKAQADLEQNLWHLPRNR